MVRRTLFSRLALGLGFGLVGVCFAQQSVVPWKDNELTWKSNDPKVNVRRSEHFRILWGQGVGTEGANVNADFGHVTEQLAQGNLQMLEQVWHRYHDPQSAGGLGLRVPSEPARKEKRDGSLYRVNLLMNNTGIYEGGAWGSVDDIGLPLFALPPTYLSYDPPSGATPHEYGHTVLISAGGFNNTPWDGMWHEATANWLMLQFNNGYPGPGGIGMQPYLSMPHGRNYYDAWLLWEALREDPRYGSAFVNTMWTQAKGSEREYIFDAMARLDTSGSPDHQGAIKDAIGRMAAKNVMWDYQRGPFFRMHSPRSSDFFAEIYRRAYTELVRREGSTAWYRVPFAHAPMQGGYNVVPIALNGKKGGNYPVTMDFRPLWDPTRHSDWRATLVAVNDNGECRYSPMWNAGRNSITLSADENKLYLAVAATPDLWPFEGFQHPKISDPTLQPQAYEIAFVNTKAGPYESKPAPPKGVAGKPHPRGGGFVADTAKVDATAYVGPHAMVLGNAQVLGNARIEDFAVVTDSAIVKDGTRVSGHALVKESAQVSGSARVRDWATVGGRWKVSDHGRVLEHAYLLDAGELSGNATVKGAAADYGNAKISGYAIKEGDCANSASVDHQVLTCWVWGIDQKYADEQPDTGGVYCNFTFSRTSPIYALDTYGVLHGYLMGRPRTVTVADPARGNALRLNGKDQYIELKRDVADFRETTYAVWVNWAGGAAGQRILHFGDGAGKYLYLTPKDAKTGRLRCVLSTSGRAGEQALDGNAPLPAGRWTHLAVTFQGDTATLYVDGKPVAVNDHVTLHPEDVLAANCLSGMDHDYIGRGPAGCFFAGMVDDFAAFISPRTDAQVAELAAKPGDRGAKVVAAKPSSAKPAAPKWMLKPVMEPGPVAAMSVAGVAEHGRWAEYRFRCIAGGTGDSGWISANRWRDTGLARGRAYTYTVMMRDEAGAVSPPSAPARLAIPKGSAITRAAFEAGPAGISDTAVRMTAKRIPATAGLVEYKMTRDGGATSGWQSSPTWADTGLARGSNHRYTVQVRIDGVAGPISVPKPAVARDDTPPARFDPGEWQTRPLATVENRLVMKAMSVTGQNGCPKIEADPVEYFYHCVSGNGPDSGWVSDPAWQTPPLPDGTYRYAFKMRDTSPQKNETAYSSAEPVTISALTGYHPYPLADVAGQPEGTLAEFSGTIADVGTDFYTVTADGAAVRVTPATKGNAPDASLKGRAVKVRGCMLTVGDAKRVTWAEVSATD